MGDRWAIKATRMQKLLAHEGIIGNLADWLPYPAEHAESSMSAMPEAAKVADTLWTTANFQDRGRWMGSEVAPTHDPLGLIHGSSSITD